MFLNSELLTVTLESRTFQIQPAETVLFINLVFSTERLPLRLRITPTVPVPELLINSQSLMDKLPPGLFAIIKRILFEFLNFKFDKLSFATLVKNSEFVEVKVIVTLPSPEMSIFLLTVIPVANT